MTFPLRLSGLRTWVISMRLWVPSLASLSGLRIQCYHELWRRSQMWLRYGVAVAVAWLAVVALIRPRELPHAAGADLKRKKSVSLLLFFGIIFLNFTYKWCHVIFVFLWLTSLHMIISQSVHVATNGIILPFWLSIGCLWHCFSSWVSEQGWSCNSPPWL